MPSQSFQGQASLFLLTPSVLSLLPWHSILILRLDFQEMEVEWCSSSSLPATLIKEGLFPGAPSQPRHAFSVELLSFLKSLFERSCDATYALANALNTHYLRRGFRLTNSKVRI